MTATLLGGMVLPFLGTAVVGFLVWRAARGKWRRGKGISPGRVVIASNLVSSRWR